MFRQAQRRRNISGTASTVVCDGLTKRERVTDANYDTYQPDNITKKGAASDALKTHISGGTISHR